MFYRHTLKAPHDGAKRRHRLATPTKSHSFDSLHHLVLGHNNLLSLLQLLRASSTIFSEIQTLFIYQQSLPHVLSMTLNAPCYGRKTVIVGVEWLFWHARRG